jgi:hypothetical protein
MTCLQDLIKVERPLYAYDCEYVSDLMWSDPCADVKTYDESMRGLGVQFGLTSLKAFLECLKMRCMIRVHQCVGAGIARFGGDLLYTVFSCSHYENQENRCGLLFVDAHLQVQLFSLPLLCQIPRPEALQELLPYAPMKDMMPENSLTLKIFDLEQKNKEPKFSLKGSKENLLAKLESPPASPKPIRIGPRRSPNIVTPNILETSPGSHMPHETHSPASNSETPTPFLFAVKKDPMSESLGRKPPIWFPTPKARALEAKQRKMMGVLLSSLPSAVG